MTTPKIEEPLSDDRIAELQLYFEGREGFPSFSITFAECRSLLQEVERHRANIRASLDVISGPIDIHQCCCACSDLYNSEGAL